MKDTGVGTHGTFSHAQPGLQGPREGIASYSRTEEWVCLCESGHRLQPFKVVAACIPDDSRVGESLRSMRRVLSGIFRGCELFGLI